MSDILVIGSFMMDLVAKTPKAPREGETIIGHSFSQFPGGKGANQAVAAARLGAKVAMLGKVGNDGFGDSQIESLKLSHVDTQYILRDDKASTGVGFITLEANGKNRIIIIPGANMFLTSKDIINKEELIKKYDVIILQLEIPLETVYASIDIAHKHGKTVILNPAPSAKLDKGYLEKVDYFIPNEIETKDFTDIDVTDSKSARQAAKILLEYGCKNVLITMGDKGVYFLNKKMEEHFVKGIEVEAVDTTAAGDEFIGAYAFGLSQGLCPSDCLRLANSSAALSVTRMGAQPSLPNISDVKMFMEKLGIDLRREI